MAKKLSSVVLLSAGLDSSFNLFQAARETDVRLALTFDYGQRAAARELEKAEVLARALGVRHQVVSLPWFQDFTQTALLGKMALPTGGDVQIDNLEKSQASAKAVWVPNRNGIFLNIAAGFAEGLQADLVIPGFNREEAVTFADNSAAFLREMDKSLSYSTATKVRVHCYSIDLDKTEIVSKAIPLGVPLKQLWPCYLAGDKWCGQCESCLRFKRALAANGLSFDLLKE